MGAQCIGLRHPVQIGNILFELRTGDIDITQKIGLSVQPIQREIEFGMGTVNADPHLEIPGPPVKAVAFGKKRACGSIPHPSDTVGVDAQKIVDDFDGINGQRVIVGLSTILCHPGQPLPEAAQQRSEGHRLIRIWSGIAGVRKSLPHTNKKRTHRQVEKCRPARDRRRGETFGVRHRITECAKIIEEIERAEPAGLRQGESGRVVNLLVG